jgi:hypothetical protein
MDHLNLVVVHYNQYAGGKFFINCLSHHARVLPGLCVAAPDYDYDHWIFDPGVTDKEQRKIDRINTTIAPPDRMHEWAQAELGCTQFWGGLYGIWIHSEPNPNPCALKLLPDYRCFIVNHDLDCANFAQTEKFWPRAKHILLTNSTQFQQRAMTLKSPGFELKHTIDPYAFKSVFVVDVDRTWLDITHTITTVEKCLKWLGLDYAWHHNMFGYINRYFSVHQ